MPRTSQLQTNFNAGELSPNLLGRTDYVPYLNGSSVLENFSCHPQGWMHRRKGTRFVAEIKNNNKARIIPFSFNISQNLIIEIGAGYFRFFLNQSAVTSGENIYEIANPFIESDLNDIRFVQKDDVIYLTHPLRGIFKLIRLGNSNWTFNAITLFKGPFMDENIISTNLVNITGNLTKGGTSTLTASGGHTPFTTNHIGSLWRVTSGADNAYLKITGFTSSTVVTCVNQEDIPASLHGGTTFHWSEGEFSLARSFPRAITFHEGRLFLAGTINATQKIWASKSNDFENFLTGTLANDAFNRTIAATSNDSILWLFSDESLFIGTSESIWVAKPSSNSAGLSNTDFGAKRQVSFGSSNLAPIYADDSAFYLQRGDQKIRSLTFSLQKDKNIATDITIKSDHITGEGLFQFAYQMNPISTIYGLRKDGQCVCAVYESAQEVLAWNRIVTDGSYESIASIPSSSTYDEVYFIVNRTINGTTKRFIEVLEPNFDYSNLGSFFVDCGLTYNGIKTSTLTTTTSVATASSATFISGDVGKQIHEIGGGVAKITSFISSTQVGISIIKDFFPTIKSWGIAVNAVAGLSHLEGKTVSVAGDGSTIPDKVVSSGAVALTNYYLIIHCGLKFVSTRTSMPLEMTRLEGVIGSTQGKISRIDTVLINFANTRGGQLFDARNKELTLNMRSLTDDMDATTPLLNGSSKIDFASDWSDASVLTIKQSEPQPMNVRSMTYYLSINDY